MSNKSRRLPEVNEEEDPNHWPDDPVFWGMFVTYEYMGRVELRALVRLAADTIAQLEFRLRGGNEG